MAICTFVENLGQVAQAVNSWHEHAEPFAFPYLLTNPFTSITPKLFDSCRTKFIFDPFVSDARDTEISQEEVAIAASFLNESSGLIEFFNNIGELEGLVSLRRKLALDYKLSAQILAGLRFPLPSEGTVATAVLRVEERLDCLA